jgi:hypothetical protein
MGVVPRGSHDHQRAPSTSSIGSVASMSATPGQGLQQQQASRGVRVNDQRKFVPGQYRDNQSARSHLPSPRQTPTRSTFITPTSQAFAQSQDINSTVAASLAMNTALLGSNQHPEDDMAHLSRSNRPSFSSMGQGPATPATVNEHHDQSQRPVQNDMTSAMVPKFERTYSDALQDELYFPQDVMTSQAGSNPNFLMPHGNKMVNERLLEAQMARSQSSGSTQSIPLSPFRTGYVPNENEPSDLKYQMSPNTESEPKTISPKDAILDYKPSSSDFPLFPQSTSGMTGSYSAVAPSVQRQQQYAQPAVDYSSVTSAPNWGSNLTLTSGPLQSYQGFATPSLPPNMGMSNMATGYLGNALSQSARSVSRQTDRTPEFPAQLTSMESSASEAAPPSSQASSMLLNSPKPDSSADTGTYSCTYHGCLRRFSTPQKLQRHKRDEHRNNPNVTPGVGSGMSTAELMERNSQSGPHKCDRINPTTGKPCSTVFSRPYDLTRHEDTIHNIRKQKVRCAICTEEKTFSRSDALTRHMRVVHPEIDFPGKHRKRGSRGD